MKHEKMENPSQIKRQLKRIDWKIVRRVVAFLYYDGGIKKTNMAMKCTMSYDRCVLYLDWLNAIGLIKKELDEDGFELISLSDKGIEFYKRNFEDI
jgi:predicted transcriptional regulator